MRISTAFAAVAAFCFGAPAAAQFVSGNYAITGTGSGTISLAYDADTSIYSLIDLDFTILGAHFDETNAGIQPFNPNPAFQGVVVGGNLGGVGGLGSGTDDFFFAFAPNYPPSPQLQSIDYAVGGPIGHGTVSITQLPPTAVPEPATWAMMLLGLGAAGIAVGRRRGAILRAG